MKNLFLLFALCITSLSYAQTIHFQEYYEGTLDNKTKIIFYFKMSEDGCPRTYVDAIYKYATNKNNEWILLNTTFSEEKQQYTLVEHYNTGMFLLKRDKGKLFGLWISPDGKKQLKVDLTKIKVPKTKIESLENQLEKEQYEAHDC
ncbi:hypothetical protein [Flavobacterium sp. H122]|uniref:hypothetical protein n=1 Tax=Flavobacterium sp. H122 TaxID=2529860 RepID=UPI0010AAEB45|nr:hypothetical protein [Flavobacterium sp. H122]